MSSHSKLRTLTEVAGTVSIFVSLVLVALELRDANNLAEAEAVLSINEMVADKLNGDVQLEWRMQAIAEKRGIDMFAISKHFDRFQWLNISEAAWKMFERGIIDEPQFEAYSQAACRTIFSGIDIETLPWVGTITWDEFKLEYNQDYISDLERRCARFF